MTSSGCGKSYAFSRRPGERLKSMGARSETPKNKRVIHKVYEYYFWGVVTKKVKKLPCRQFFCGPSVF